MQHAVECLFYVQQEVIFIPVSKKWQSNLNENPDKMSFLKADVKSDQNSDQILDDLSELSQIFFIECMLDLEKTTKY
jgi:hypothetical protein